MRIGITQRVELIASYGEQRDCLDQQWFRLIEGLGHVPIPVPNSLKDVSAWADAAGLEGLILSGGNDLAHLVDASNCSADRDNTERALLAHAKERKWPVLGVCRGLQMINVWLGGELTPVLGHAAVRHSVTPLEMAAACFREFHEVNSFHNWGIAIDGLAADLSAQLQCAEGHVEAFEHKTLPWTGIMWHPEREAPFSAKDTQLLQRIFQR